MHGKKITLFQAKVEMHMFNTGLNTYEATKIVKTQIINDNDIKHEFYLISDKVREAMKTLELQSSEICMSTTTLDTVVDNGDDDNYDFM